MADDELASLGLLTEPLSPNGEDDSYDGISSKQERCVCFRYDRRDIREMSFLLFITLSIATSMIILVFPSSLPGGDSPIAISVKMLVGGIDIIGSLVLLYTRLTWSLLEDSELRNLRKQELREQMKNLREAVSAKAQTANELETRINRLKLSFSAGT